MKTTQKTGLLIIFIGSLLFPASFNSLSAQIITEPGVYVTYHDYIKHNLTKYDEISIDKHGYKGVLKGEKVPVKEYKDVNFWALQDGNGVVYRINKKADMVEQVVSHGKVCYYAPMELVIKRNDDGSLKSMDITAPAGTKFSDIFLVSKGGNGEMIGASVDNLTLLFADSPTIVSKMKAKGIDETNVKHFIDDFLNVADRIREYDKKHK
jgi:hypothetical protein